MIFLITLFLCILLHELGHLLVAKLCKCNVEEFSIGFGKEIFKIKIKDTVYKITPWLLGGYCKLQDELTCSESKYAFTNLRYSKKVSISLAGIFVNILTGLIGIFIGYLLLNYSLVYFGELSIVLGITNLLPIPALDGSYIFLVLLEKKYGKKKGYELMDKLCKVGFKIIMILNILCLPYLIWLFIQGKIS